MQNILPKYQDSSSAKTQHSRQNIKFLQSIVSKISLQQGFRDFEPVCDVTLVNSQVRDVQNANRLGLQSTCSHLDRAETINRLRI